MRPASRRAQHRAPDQPAEIARWRVSRFPRERPPNLSFGVATARGRAIHPEDLHLRHASTADQLHHGYFRVGISDGDLPFGRMTNGKLSLIALTKGFLLCFERIEHFQKRESVEISISRADSCDSVLAHEDCRVCVMYQIAGQVRQLREDLPRDIGMSLCRDENTDPRRRQQRCDELPGSRCTPGLSHHARMGSHAQKLVKNRPGRKQGIRPRSLTLELDAAGRMKRRVRVCGVYEHVRVNGDHYLPSIA
jgi:hypothetical protein